VKRRLIVLDCLAHPGWTRLPADTASQETFLLLGLTRAGFEQSYATTLAERSWSYFPAEGVALSCHQRTREFVVRLVDDLSRSQLARELGPEWWYLELVEKNAGRGEWIEQLYRLCLIEAALAESFAEVVLQIQHPELAAAVRSGLPQARSVVSGRPPRLRSAPGFVRGCLAALAVHVLTWLFSRPFWGTLVAASDRALTFTVYPIFWAGRRERFLPSSPSPYLAWLAQPGRLWKERRWLAEQIRQGRLLPLQSALSLLDGLRLLDPRRWWRCVRLDATAGRAVSAHLGPWDVSALVRAELARSLGSREFFQNLMLATALRRLRHRARPRAVVYRCEFQGLENALIQTLRGQVRLIGFRHSSTSQFLLSHLFEPGELGPRRPAPDLFWTPGERARQLLADQGWPRERVVLCGPQRQPELGQPRASHPLTSFLASVPDGACVVMVALVIRPVENEALLDAVLPQLADFPQLRLLLRPHPVAPQLPSALTRHASIGIVPHDVPALPVLAACDALVTPGSTMAFEAMAVGVMPIVYEEPSTFSFNSLADYANSLFVVRDRQGLRQALASIIAKGPEDRRRRELWPATVEAVLGDLQTPLARQFEEALGKSLEDPR